MERYQIKADRLSPTHPGLGGKADLEALYKALQLPHGRYEGEISNPKPQGKLQRESNRRATAASEREYQRNRNFSLSDLGKGLKATDRAAGRLIEAASPSSYINPNGTAEEKLMVDMVAPFGAAKAVKYAPEALSSLARGAEAVNRFMVPVEDGEIAFGMGGFGNIVKPKIKENDYQWNKYWDKELADNPAAFDYVKNSAFTDPNSGIPARLRHLQLPEGQMEMGRYDHTYLPLQTEFPEQMSPMGRGRLVSANRAGFDEQVREAQLAKGDPDILKHSNTYELVTNAQNPYLLDDDKFRKMAAYLDMMDKAKLNDPRLYAEMQKKLGGFNANFEDLMKRGGHDAVVHVSPGTGAVSVNTLRPGGLKDKYADYFDANHPNIFRALAPLSALGGAMYMQEEQP